MPNTLTKRGGPAAVAAAARMPALADEGIAVAIVAVTGIEDSVNDVITPGAFAATLRARRPKFCWMHDWKRPLGRVLSIIELRPGDKRLPKTLPDGRAWPAKAGALLATVQFNLKTQDGRDYYEFAKQWQLNGEAAFSIGYRVPDGLAAKRADGVRVIFGLELFEVSLVLHGAHNMALALEVKGADFGIPDLEYKDMAGVVGGAGDAPAQPDHSAGSMVALYPSPDVADVVAVDSGLAPEDLHITVAYLGKDTVADPAALTAALRAAVASVGPLDGTIGGLGTFPPGDDGTPVWAPVDVPGLDTLRTAVVDALAKAGQPIPSEHGFTPHMTLGYDLQDPQPVPPTRVSFPEAYLVVGTDRHPLPLTPATPPMEGKAAVMSLYIADGRHAAAALLEAKSGLPGVADTPSDHEAVQRLRDAWTSGSVAKKIGWGSPGDFDRCTALATEYMSAEDAKGWCNLRHHDALGIYPATHAKLEGKADPTIQSSTTPTAQNQETKSMAYMKGSQEELRSALNTAVEELLTPVKKGETPDEGSGWACIDATFPDYVIATRNSYRGPAETFKIGYTFDGESVSLGAPSKVELSIVALPEEDDAGVPDADDAPALDQGPDIRLRFIDPAAAFLTDAARYVSAAPEGKSLEDGIHQPLMLLLDALAVKGYDVAGAVMGELDHGDPYGEDDEEIKGAGMDDDPDDTSDDPAYADGDEDDAYGSDSASPAGDPWSGVLNGQESAPAPSASSAPAPAETDPAESDPNEAEPDGDPDDEEADPNEQEPDDDEDDGTVTLDPNEVHAQMASLRA